MSFLRRVVSGSVQLTLSNAFVRLIAIVTLPILTKMLSPQSYGVAALAGTVISLASVIALAGIDTTYLRTYHSKEQPSGATAEHFCWRFSILNALLTAALGAVAWHFFSSGSVDPQGHFAIIVAAGIAFSVLGTMAQLRALLVGRYRALALVTAVAGVVGAVTSIGIAIWRRDAVALLVPLLLTYLIPIVLLGTPRVGLLRRHSELTWSEGAGLVKIGLAGVVTAPMYWLLSSSDRWFIERFHGPDAVGVYSIGYSVAIVGMVINVPVMAVWQPEAAREYEEDQARARITLGRLMSRLIAAMAVVWLAATAAGGDILRWLASERFHAAAAYVPYIAGGVFFYGVLRLATTGLLLVKRLNWAALWWLAGAVVCVVLNFMLVPQYGAVGAAISQAASFGFIAVGILGTAQAKFHLQLESARLVAIMLPLLAAGICMAPPWNQVAGLSMLMKLPVGVVITLAVGAIMAPDWCAKAVIYLRRRLPLMFM